MTQTHSSKREQASKIEAKGVFMQVQRMYSTVGKNLFVLTLLCMLFTVSTLTTQAASVSQSQPALRQLFSHSRPNIAKQGATVIQSVANKNYVSAELGYTGGNYAMLRARASTAGPWEQYTFNCFVNSSGNVQCTIQSQANKNYVSAELGYTGGNYAMLRARASTAGPWEQFILNCSNPNYCTLQSMANGNYVSAELGYTGGNYAMLRARASVVGPWEQFQ